MIKFKVSAPGKVILYGEPLAMYEKNAVAASVDLRTTLKFCELTDELSIIKIEFPDVDLSLILSLELVLNFFFCNNCIDLRDNILLLKHVQYFITVNDMWTTYEQRFSLQTFFFLFIYMIQYEDLYIKSFRVHLTTELPIGAGLGSSTSFAVCIATCFLHWGRLQKGDDGAFSDIDLEAISEYAKNCEEVVQNYIIEVDYDVCSYGQMIRYRYDCRNKNVNILDVPRMKILLIDSKIRQNKREQMEQLAVNYHSSTNSILNLLDGLSNQACQKLVEINNDMTFRQLQETYAALGVSLFFPFFFLRLLILLCYVFLNSCAFTTNSNR